MRKAARKELPEREAAYKVIDRRGKGPGAYTTNLYATPTNTGQSNSYRPRPFTFDDFTKHVDVSTWQTLISFSRQLYSQLGNLGASIRQKNTYAVGCGWLPQFNGTNQAWGERVEEWLVNVFYPVADVRGEPYDFQQNLFLDAIALDVDGDSGMLLTRSESGFPQLQWVPAHRIGQRNNWHGATVESGPFSGAKIQAGCITNRTGRVIGYRILGATPEEDKDVSASDFQLLYEPEVQSQFRGIPRISSTLLDWCDVQDIDTYLKRVVKLQSTIGLIERNEEGGPTARDIMFGADTTTSSASGIEVQTIEGGEIRYFKNNSANGLETLKTETPSPNTEAFIARLERRGLLAVGWFYELIDPSKVGGASVRLIQDQARHSVLARQKTIRKRAYRAIIYAIARAIKAGFLPANDAPNMDWMRWDFTTPPQLTVDEGYSRAADIDDLDRGLTTKAAVCGKYGRWWEDVDKQRDRETVQLLNRVKAISDETGAAFDLVLQLLQSRTAFSYILPRSQPDPNAAQDAAGYTQGAGDLSEPDDDEA